MAAALFISYAWTSDQHREWVRLLAANLKAIGHDVLIDADVDYGDSLTGFMQRATDSRHVLLVVDENYVYRADNVPESGVAIENGWFKTVYEDKPAPWLSVMFKDNPAYALPAWLVASMPKGHSFNADPINGSFPGSEQVEELWRWIEELPANRDHATSIETLRARAIRLERIDRERDPASWANPAIEGEIDFAYERSPGRRYSLGAGEFSFVLDVSAHHTQSVYVLKDPIHAVGLNLTGTTDHGELASQLTPGRSVVAHEGQQIILQNEQGALCLIDLLGVRRETTQPDYTPASIQFRYRILTDS